MTELSAAERRGGARLPNRPPNWSRSLRFRLTAWYVAALALLLIGANVLLYTAVRYTLLSETDSFLRLEVRRLASAVAGPSSDPGDADDLAEAVHLSPSGAEGTPPPPPETLPGLILLDVAYLRCVRVSDRHVLASSPELTRQPALVRSLDRLLPTGSETPLSASGQLGQAGQSGRIAFAGPDEERTLRVLTLPVATKSGVLSLQAAVPWDHNADVLERLALVLTLALPLALLPIALGGWALVGRTLRPIARIVTEAERLDAADLPLALLPRAAESDSEVGQLVETLNRMTTRLQRAFAAERRFAETQQQFAANASHELRTPLTILRGEIEVSLSRPRSPEIYRATLESALEEIARMGRIVEGLGVLARRDDGRTKADDVTVDLAAIAAAAAAEWQARASAKHLRLGVETGPPPVPLLVRGSADQLLQLVRNLLENAVKYTPDGGAIHITTGITEGATASLTVRDTGAGIAAPDLPQVFRRFWRGESARSQPGSGLGLALCAQIAGAHGGDLSVTSDIGLGSAFTLRLPLVGVGPGDRI